MKESNDEKIDVSGLSDKLAEEEYSRLNKSYEFHLDFSLKVVAFFYAALGAVLSIYFAGLDKINDAYKLRLNDVLIVLLVIPIVMSAILGRYFWFGGNLWKVQTDYMFALADRLHIPRKLQVKILSELLRIFGVLFFFTTLALILLLWRSY
jgi:hypothetical protein